MPAKNIYALLLALLPIGALAQSTEKSPETMLHQIGDVIEKDCPMFIQGLAGMQDMKAAFKERPTDVVAVCKCAKNEILDDRRLFKQLAVEHEVLVHRMKNGNLSSYLSVRGLQAILRCSVQDLDQSLAAIKLEEQ